MVFAGVGGVARLKYDTFKSFKRFNWFKLFKRLGLVRRNSTNSSKIPAVNDLEPLFLPQFFCHPFAGGWI